MGSETRTRAAINEVGEPCRNCMAMEDPGDICAQHSKSRNRRPIEWVSREHLAVLSNPPAYYRER